MINYNGKELTFKKCDKYKDLRLNLCSEAAQTEWA